MAENVELNLINHLLDVEKDANGVIAQAMEEADKRLAETRAKYNAVYKQKYDVIVNDLKEKYDASIQELENNHNREISDYKTYLEGENQNYSEFSKLLDSLLQKA